MDELAMEKIHDEMFPIRTVSTLTGVQTVTLRAWERRYKLIKPVRTESGHRLYSREDIELIRKAAGLLEKGMSISQAAQILIDPDYANAVSFSGSAAWVNYQQQILNAIFSFDDKLLEDIYQRALSFHPVETVTRKLIEPVLETLGYKWSKIPDGIAAEHFFSVFLRNKLGARFHHRNQNNSGPKLICSSLPEDRHEIGLLLFSLAADEANFRQVLLGADMPLQHLVAAAQKASVNAIVLSGKYPSRLEPVAKEIEKIAYSSGIPVFIGGDVCINNEAMINAIGAISLGNKIDDGILILNKHLKTKTNRKPLRDS